MESASGLFDLTPRERAARCLLFADGAEEMARAVLDLHLRASYRRIAAHWVEMAAEAADEAMRVEALVAPRIVDKLSASV
ncbi:MAG TPA: hypothetical protein VGI20_08325 [Rhizomicrobium sp.]|jgi:hypothetical protein